MTSTHQTSLSAATLATLAHQIKAWGQELGFAQVGITDCDLSQYEPGFLTWLEKNFHGEMDYMARHGTKRSRPAELVPGTVRILSVRMDYLPPNTAAVKVLQDSTKGYVSRYAVGGDYHKFMRKKLEQLAQRIQAEIGAFGYRAFTDSAPVLERPIAEKAGLGWTGKNTLLLNQQAGSWFFLGELFTDLPLPIDAPLTNELCGNCVACLKICPTQAFVGPYQLDARRCISYLTIELKGSIPEEFRPLMGNRIYGCDDCQLVCPWNRFAKASGELQFQAKNGLENTDLVKLFLWNEQEFLRNTEGSAIRRLGYERWLRNIAVALGNAPTTPEIITVLQQREQDESVLVREHVAWALQQHANNTANRKDKNILKLSTKLNENY